MKRSDATAALSWANNTRATGDTRITSTELHVLIVIAGGCSTRAEIAAAVGCAESTVPRCVRKLVKIGALKRTPQDGKANVYEVKPRQIDTGIASDTGIATSRTTKTTRITKAPPSNDTGANDDTAPAVDNSDAHIRNAGARGLDNLLTEEDTASSETPEMVVIVTVAQSDTPPPPAWQRVLDAVRSPFLDENKSQRLILEGAIVQGWIDAGADEHLDVIPTVRRLIESKREDVPWTYFSKAVREAAARRKRAEAAQEKITPEEANIYDKHRNRDADPGVRRRQRSALTQRAMQLISHSDEDDGRGVGAFAGK